MKIGILQTGHVPEELAEKHGVYPDMFAELLEGYGFSYETWPVVDNVFPESVHDAQGWLITGSKHGAYEDHAWIPPLEEFIRNIYTAEIPLIGVCFGHQIMAQALGGKVERFGGKWGVGNQDYTFSTGETSTLIAMHQDQVVKAPPEATTTATSEFCEHAAFSYKGNAISIQPHPEFSQEFIRDLVEMRRGSIIPEDQADAALADLDRENDAADYAAQMAAFFKENAKVDA